MTGTVSEPIFTLQRTCQVFKVTPPTGSELVGQGALVIASSSQQLQGAGPGHVTIQVGQMAWPLSSGLASLRYDNLTYTFQLDPASPAYLCLVLPRDSQPEELGELQHILAAVSAYHAELPASSALQSDSAGVMQPAERQGVPVEVKAKTSADRIASGLVYGGAKIGQGVVALAGMAARQMQKSAQSHMATTQRTDKPVVISNQAMERAETVRSLTAKTAEASGRIAEAVFKVTAEAGAAIAARLARAGVSPKGGISQDVRTVGVAGLEALEQVYESLANAARLVVSVGRHEATRVVDHKYGAEAGAVTSTSLAAAQDVVETGLHVYKVRPTALAKAVVKETAKQVVVGGAAAGGVHASASGSSLSSAPGMLPPAAGAAGPSGSGLNHATFVGAAAGYSGPGVSAGAYAPAPMPGMAQGVPMPVAQGTPVAAPPSYYPAVPRV